MKATQLLALAGGMMSLSERRDLENKISNERYWNQIKSKCSHCKGLCSPQQVFCSDECRNEYKG